MQSKKASITPAIHSCESAPKVISHFDRRCVRADDCRLALFCSSRHWERYFLRCDHPLLPFRTTRAAPLCRGWMDRTSNDCSLFYEIIGPRGRVRAIQAPEPDDRIESGLRERDREARGEGGHRRGPQSCSPYTTSEYIVSGNIRIVASGEKREKRGWRSDIPCNGERRFTRLDDPKATWSYSLHGTDDALVIEGLDPFNVIQFCTH